MKNNLDGLRGSTPSANFHFEECNKKNNRTLPGSRIFHLNGNEFNSGAISVLMCYRCVKEAYSD